MKFKVLIGAIAVSLFAVPMSASADSMYLKVSGNMQGPFKGGISQKGHENQIKVLEYSYQVVSPRDMASGLPTGKRMHKPFVITMELDKASPQLFNAIVNNETCTVELQLWRPQMKSMGTGMEVEAMTIQLTNAGISSYALKTVEGPAGKTPTTVVEVSFTFQKITMTWVDGGITGMDDWASRA